MFQHVTVLKEEAVDGLAIKPGGIYVDCTLGGAGHSELIASRLSEGGRLIALDQDDLALDHARIRLADYMDQVTLVKSNFRYLEHVLRDLVSRVLTVCCSILVSQALSLTRADRGFSYNHDAPLDMRMDQDSMLTANDIVNTWDDREISRILTNYGEERFARQIARKIVKAREQKPIETTGELVELIKSGIPAATRRTGPHPAKRTFQALRIAVNDELGAEEEALEQTVNVLKSGGRASVITFHSLEDRICKQLFAKFVEKCTCPTDFPLCVCGGNGKLKLVNRKPIVPSEEELEINPRARSAKLRVAEKL